MRRSDTIFVSIASYRDPELIPTLSDMITQAEDPSALHIAVCWQHDESISLFIDAGMKLDDHRKQGDYDVFLFNFHCAIIEVISVHYYESKGACWARHMAEQLYQDEEWFLQIDSHCRFNTSWDREAITMARSLIPLTPRPILSTYPPAYDPADDSKRTHFISRLVFREFSSEGIPMLSSVPFTAQQPTRCGYLAGGFVFAPGSFVRDVPNDPEIFFAGEEIAMAARAFTHGYDIYTPNKILVWHYYQRKDANKIWGDHTNDAKKNGVVDRAWWERDKLSKQRVRMILGLETSTEQAAVYGHGILRTLAEFERRIGVHLVSQTVMPAVTNEQRLSYFPDGSYSDEDWVTRRIHPNKRKISFTQHEITLSENDISWWHIGVYSQGNQLLEKKTLTQQEMTTCYSEAKKSWEIEFNFTTPSGIKPAVVRACPFYSVQGWGSVVEKQW